MSNLYLQDEIVMNKSFSLRIDSELLQALEIICKKERRSKNQQLNCLIENFVKDYLREHPELETELKQN